MEGESEEEMEEEAMEEEASGTGRGVSRAVFLAASDVLIGANASRNSASGINSAAITYSIVGICRAIGPAQFRRTIAGTAPGDRSVKRPPPTPFQW